MGLNDIVVGQDGSFEIFLSKNRPVNAKNWIPLADGDHCFLIRRYFRERGNIRPSQLKIERTDTNSTAGVAGISHLQRLQHAREMLVDYIEGTLEINDLLRQNALNDYPKPGAKILQPKYGGSMYPTKDNVYQGFRVSLKPDEAIHLHGKPPKALYASYVFYDRWYQTPDYGNVNCFRTTDELVLNSDGSYDIYISPIMGKALGKGFNSAFLAEFPTTKKMWEATGPVY